MEVSKTTTVLGCTATDNACTFRYYCPRASAVELELFESYDQSSGQRHPMQRSEKGTWELTLEGSYIGQYYGYRVSPPTDGGRTFMPSDFPIADPWSIHVTTKNHYLQYPLTLITPPPSFDWGDDDYVSPTDPRDLIIYETHLRDMTAHPSSGAKKPGTYEGFCESGIRGGIEHLKRLGVNAVEFLPLQKFPQFEPPYLITTPEGQRNTWNLYGRNHWGYMTSFFFVPETYYASDGTDTQGEILGRTLKAHEELKKLVKALHDEGIAVIMDVVYNHASQYDRNCLKYTDKRYYFRLNAQGEFMSNSGCGNDLKSESDLTRRLIIESILYWMTYFHIDGFRFDLALNIDWDTIEAIREAALDLNPNVLLIAEPWHLKGYDPTGFSDRSWSAWNDHFRNTLRGTDPVAQKGFLLNGFADGYIRHSLETILKGTIRNADGEGLFNSSQHAVNYIECHDNLTFGDWLRIDADPKNRNRIFDNREEIVQLNKDQLRTARLAAFFLMVSQGIPMIHSGQEWARSRIIASSPINDPRTFCIDPNPYNKDNETNYLNYDDINLNKSLVDYYIGLIALRKSAPGLRASDPDKIRFLSSQNLNQITYQISCSEYDDPYDYFISINGDKLQENTVELPQGEWELMADGSTASPESLRIISNNIKIPASTGIIARKLHT